MKLKWIVRISAVIVMLISVPFYFGYGNPLPFIDASYSVTDNIWLCLFPLVFIGLGLGWIYEILGGFIVLGSILSAFIMGILLNNALTMNIVLPLIVGILFIISGTIKKTRSCVRNDGAE